MRMKPPVKLFPPESKISSNSLNDQNMLLKSIMESMNKEKKSRKEKENLKSEEKEILVGYCKEQQKNNPVDYYVFGHRHIPMEVKIDERANYINLGDWIHHYSYAVLSNKKLELKSI